MIRENHLRYCVDHVWNCGEQVVIGGEYVRRYATGQGEQQCYEGVALEPVIYLMHVCG